MKSTTRIIKVIGITLLIGCAAARAENWSDNLYLHADVGPAFVGNGPSSFRSFIPPDDSSRGKGHFQADTEIRGDLALGYNLTKSFAVEIEAGAIWNPTENSDDFFYQIPAMMNAVYQIQFSHSWKAYAGLGAGAVTSHTHSLFPIAAFHTPFVLDDWDWSFGYQAEAGIKYALSRHLDVDLGYKFLGVYQYDYTFGHPGRPEGFLIIERVNDLFTHSAQLSLTWKF